jgi:16S rRNA (cytosine967-C5)-methyltransferase
MSEAGVAASPGSFAPDAIRIPAGGYTRLPSRLRERLFIQDEGSQLVTHVVSAQPRARILDVCASPGGKTSLMAQAMHGQGLIVAGDRRRPRIALLSSTLARTGTHAHVVVLDAGQPLPFVARFDAVLLDAPCSGLGTLRRDPDLKWIRRPEELAPFARTQQQMLRHAAEAVAEHGVLVYATCSSEPEENIQVVDSFLEADRRFALAPALPAAFPAGLLDSRGCLATTPFRHGLDAFFAARLVRVRAA